MTKEKVFIKNRKGQKIAVLIEQPEKPKGLAFVMHGRSGGKEEPHISTFAEGFAGNGYVVVRFDTTNTFGESDGDYENLTMTGFYEDLEDVIKWAETQQWYLEPFCLSGHSMGGMAIVLYAEKYPQKIKGLAPISAVVSGERLIGAMDPSEVAEWKETGWWTQKSSRPGIIKRLKWSHAVDFMKYDIMPGISKLTMPVLMIIGGQDAITRVEDQKVLFSAIPHSHKELHIIKDAPHTFRDPAHLAAIKAIFDHWIKSL